MKAAARLVLAVLAAALFSTLILTLTASQAQAQVPAAAQPYRLTLKRNAQMLWGLDAPVATFAAQVHQESRWRPDARSPVGALGLAQFMPATAAWMGDVDAELRGPQPMNPTWALRALVRYDLWLWQRIKADSPCERMAFTLAAYNSGLGTVLKKRADVGCSAGVSCKWFGQAEHSPAGQSAENLRETRGYAQRILWQHEPAYIAAGWGRGSCP